MTIPGRALARLARPFEGGNGPSHGTLDRIFLSEDAHDYLPKEGNKADRVLGGLKALRDGSPVSAVGYALPPDAAKLRMVAEALVEELVGAGLLSEDDAVSILGGEPVAPPTRAAPAPSAPQNHSPEAADSPKPVTTAREVVDSTSPIFVVHGHDHGLLHEVVRVFERASGRDVVVFTSRRIKAALLSRNLKLMRLQPHSRLCC